MKELIAKLEAATEGSRELNWQIAGCPRFDDDTPNYNVPRYTTSLDAALTLVPKGWQWRVQGNGLAALCAPDALLGEYSQAATPALALCIAVLRAWRAPEDTPDIAERSWDQASRG